MDTITVTAEQRPLSPVATLTARTCTEVELREPTLDDLIAVKDPLVDFGTQQLVIPSWLKLLKLCVVNVAPPMIGKIHITDTGTLVNKLSEIAFPPSQEEEGENAGKSTEAE